MFVKLPEAQVRMKVPNGLKAQYYIHESRCTIVDGLEQIDRPPQI